VRSVILTTLCIFSLSGFGSDKDAAKYIKSGKKESINCPERTTHLFCNVSETFDTPGICGHGFDCILMKIGETEKVCSVVFECVK
jgi:hypothetical protein